MKNEVFSLSTMLLVLTVTLSILIKYENYTAFLIWLIATLEFSTNLSIVRRGSRTLSERPRYLYFSIPFHVLFAFAFTMIALIMFSTMNILLTIGAVLIVVGSVLNIRSWLHHYEEKEMSAQCLQKEDNVLDVLYA